MTPNDSITPFVGPLLGLLRSRKFLAALMTLVIDALVAYLPALEPVRTELLVVFTFVGSTLVAAIAYEDGHKARAGLDDFFDIYVEDNPGDPAAE